MLDYKKVRDRAVIEQITGAQGGGGVLAGSKISSSGKIKVSSTGKIKVKSG